MKISVLIFLLIFIFAGCEKVQTQQISTANSTSPPASSNDNGYEVGYPRFTTTDKQYLGCWRSTRAEEIVDYKLKFFRLTEQTIQTSKMLQPVTYKEIDSNKYRDWFVLKAESKSSKLRPFLNINMVDNDEMTISESATQDLSDEHGDYWNLKRESCDKF